MRRIVGILVGSTTLAGLCLTAVSAQSYIFRRSLEMSNPSVSAPEFPPATDTGDQASGEPDTGEPDTGEEEETVAEACDTTPVVASSGLYSPPPGCSRVRVQAWGGGGKGASCRLGMLTNTCYGGGGGAHISVIVTLDPNRSYLVTVGGGGKGVSGANGAATSLRDGPYGFDPVLVEAPGGYAGDDMTHPGQGGDSFDPTGSAPQPIKGGSGGGSYESFYPEALYVGGGGGGAGQAGSGNNGGKGGPSGHGAGGNGGSGGGGRGGNGGSAGGNGQEPGGGGGAGLNTGGGGGNGANGRIILTPIE